MNMNNEEIMLTIIGCSGDSRCCSLEAIDLAKEGRFAEAKEKLKTAEERLIEAHKAHTELLSETAKRADYAVTFIMVHASNNLTQAETTADMAKNFVYVLEQMKEER